MIHAGLGYENSVILFFFFNPPYIPPVLLLTVRTGGGSSDTISPITSVTLFSGTSRQGRSQQRTDCRVGVGWGTVMEEMT